MWGDNEGTFDQGGGFLNSPGFGSPTQGEGDRRTQSQVRTMVPCTVAQVRRAEQSADNFVIDGIELHQVTLVGLVRGVNELSSRTEYKIDDMSGEPIDVRVFVDVADEGDAAPRPSPVRENTYARVYGKVRSFQEKRSLVAFRISPVTDMNELTMHLLDVIRCHLSLTKPQRGGAGANAQPGYVAGAAAPPASARPAGYAGAVGGPGVGGGEPMAGLSNIQGQVEMVIRGCQDESGISVQEITKRLRGIPLTSVREAVEFLSTEGHIYSTVDDDHYKSTDSY